MFKSCISHGVIFLKKSFHNTLTLWDEFVMQTAIIPSIDFKIKITIASFSPLLKNLDLSKNT